MTQVHNQATSKMALVVTACLLGDQHFHDDHSPVGVDGLQMEPTSTIGKRLSPEEDCFAEPEEDGVTRPGAPRKRLESAGGPNEKANGMAKGPSGVARSLKMVQKEEEKKLKLKTHQQKIRKLKIAANEELQLQGEGMKQCIEKSDIFQKTEEGEHLWLYRFGATTRALHLRDSRASLPNPPPVGEDLGLVVGFKSQAFVRFIEAKENQTALVNKFAIEKTGADDLKQEILDWHDELRANELSFDRKAKERARDELRAVDNFIMNHDGAITTWIVAPGATRPVTSKEVQNLRSSSGNWVELKSVKAVDAGKLHYFHQSAGGHKPSAPFPLESPIVSMMGGTRSKWGLTVWTDDKLAPPTKDPPAFERMEAYEVQAFKRMTEKKTI